MGKTIIFIICIFVLISLVTAVNYEYKYNPYTGKRDRTIKLNQSGDNITADYFYGNGSGINFINCNVIANGTDTNFCVDSVGTAADWSVIQNYTSVKGCSGAEIAVGRYPNGTWNCTADQTSAFNPAPLNITNQTMFDNNTIVRSHNTSWINITVNISYIPYSGAYRNIDLGANNFTINTNNLFVDSNTGRVLIGLVGGYDPRVGLSVSGDFDVNHTATENDDHAVEIDVDAAGFGDVKAVDIVYTTGAISAGEEEAVILINIDESKATGGDVIGLGILATEGSVSIYGLEAGALVNPIVQLSGTFTDMDSANNSGVDDLTNFTSSATNSNIFVSDNDYVTIGDANKFEEIEFLLNTTASGAGIKPTFEYSTGIGTWGTFSPTDGTNGMRNTGVIAWFDSDIPTWAAGAGNEYLIRINRTANSLTTVPIEDKVQIAAVTVYKWDKDGNLVVNELNASLIRSNDWTNVTITESQITDLTHTSNTTDDIWRALANQTWDTRIDSIENFTMQDINDSFDNFSQWLDNYPNVDTDSTDDVSITTLRDTNESLKGIMLNSSNVGGNNITLDANGKLAINMSITDTTYTADEGNVTLVGTVFSLLKLDLAEHTNSLSWITVAVSTLTNYFTKSDITAMDLQNGTQVNDSITAHNTSIKVYIDAQDSEVNTTANIEILGFNETSTLGELFINETGDTMEGHFNISTYNITAKTGTIIYTNDSATFFSSPDGAALIILHNA